MPVFVYVFDLFIPTELSAEEILKEFEKDKVKPFELVKDIIENFVGLRCTLLVRGVFAEQHIHLAFAPLLPLNCCSFSLQVLDCLFFHPKPTRR